MALGNEITIQDIRKANLEIKISEFGSIAKFCDVVDKPPTHVSNIRTGKKNLGEKFARDLEKALHLPRGWFDQGHDSNISALDEAINSIRLTFREHELSTEEKEVMALYRILSERDKYVILNTIKLHAKNKT
jgi:hypothetical protein